MFKELLFFSHKVEEILRNSDISDFFIGKGSGTAPSCTLPTSAGPGRARRARTSETLVVIKKVIKKYMLLFITCLFS
jgi:hypothetical protein